MENTEGSAGTSRRVPKRSGRRRTKDRDLSDVLRTILPMEISESLAKDAGLEFHVGEDGVTAAQAMAMAQIAKAIRGDSKAFALIRDMIDRKKDDGEDKTAGAVKVDIRVVE